MGEDDIISFKNDAQDRLNDLAGQLAVTLKGANKEIRNKILDIEDEEERVRAKINQLNENIEENRWSDIKNEIKESLDKIKKELEEV